MIIDREALINSIISGLDNKRPLNTKEYNIVRGAIIDSHIAICDLVGTCKDCKFKDDTRKCPMESVDAMSDDNYCYNFTK